MSVSCVSLEEVVPAMMLWSTYRMATRHSRKELDQEGQSSNLRPGYLGLVGTYYMYCKIGLDAR